MADLLQELNERFAHPNEELSPEVATELQSIIRIHELPPEELSYKWESYCMKMGAETKLDLKTVRDFKKDLQETLEREARSKVGKGAEKRAINATPRHAATGGDAFDMLDNLVSSTPRPGSMSTAKRKSNFETPASKAAKAHATSSPTGTKVPASSTKAFADRDKAGEIDETINSHIEQPDPPAIGPTEARIKLKANTDLPKFGYKTMAMKLSEASELLDDRIEEFVSIVQEYHNLDESDMGDPTRASQSEIVTVGRIASDLQDGKLNLASLVLETQRRRGNGIRVPLKVDKLTSFDFFPGKIVALRGTNASGDFFSVREVLEIPYLMQAASTAPEIDAWNSRLEQDDGSIRPLTVLIASGPYTTEDTLDFSPFQALCDKAEELKVDSLILCGPFLDLEHPLVRDGDFDLPSDFPVEPDQATLNDVFRYYISIPIQRLAKALPSITVLICPSVRDAVSKHAAWPQDRFIKKELQLPRQVSVVTNPITISLNEIVLGMSSLDVLDQLRATNVSGGKASHGDFLARLCQNVLQQRHFFPVFPPMERHPLSNASATEDGIELDAKTIGASLDISYLKLGEMTTGLDILALPSTLKPFVKVVQGTIAINPGTLSKRRGAGTYARLTIMPRKITDEERESGDLLAHKLYERTRVDIVRI
ncbi:uncharacterized protein PV09_05048 [Verruconis gallopava]|uniref:DNA polymerase alpha subunit B n=1 Tax=Verruconis gallopava TaxID=253628 RepID=A0A0D1XMJ5_9PEZI|nr:uncharacterized protein PV09_05048 [Verruconis gallopava]KIW03741.1 hypothetical protein PV09_05048 [Verruconis gallopava]